MNLSNNNISSIPVKIKELTKLKVLNLSNNNLSQIQTGCCSLPRLETLILNNNNITSIPTQITSLVKIKRLGLANNKLTVIPSTIQQLRHLEQIDLSGNQLKKLIDGLSFARPLSLWGGNNPIIEFNENFYLGSAIKKLYLYPASIDSTNRDYLNLCKIKGNIRNSQEIETQKDKTKIMSQDKTIFICYSHKDSEYLERVNVHLKALNYENKGYRIDSWSDKRIETGDEWKEKIFNAIKDSVGAILIVSTDFLASDFIQLEELPRILDQAQADRERLFPLIVKPCRYNNSILRKFQSVNAPNQPLSGSNDTERENVYIKLMEDIDKLL